MKLHLLLIIAGGLRNKYYQRAENYEPANEEDCGVEIFFKYHSHQKISTLKSPQHTRATCTQKVTFRMEILKFR